MDKFWTRKSVLVTGGHGFVGQHLSKRLAKAGARVVVLTRKPDATYAGWGLLPLPIVCVGSILDGPFLRWLMRKEEISHVFHLAAESIVQDAIAEPTDCYMTNVIGTVNVLEAARNCRGQIQAIVVASTDKAYGDPGRNLPYREGDALRGLHPYEASKAASDLAAQTWAYSYSMPVRVTRCSNIYGPGDMHWNRIIPATIRRLTFNGRATVRKGVGAIYREYTHVEDIAEAYMLLAASAKPLQLGTRACDTYDQVAYNIGSGELQTSEQVINRVAELMGSPGCVDVSEEGAGLELPSQCLASTKFRFEFPRWRPCLFEDGLSETVRWYRQYLSDNA